MSETITKQQLGGWKLTTVLMAVTVVIGAAVAAEVNGGKPATNSLVGSGTNDVLVP